MTPDEMREIILSFPGAEEGVSYGAPAYKVNGKFFTRLRREDQSVVLTGISFDERDMLMEAEPATFHTTPHYKDYPSAYRNFLDRKWREIAPKALVKAFDAAKA